MSTPVEDALAELDRRARHRWLVVVLVAVAAGAAGALLLIGGIAVEQRLWLAAALALVVLLYLLSVLLEERRHRRAARALGHERERVAGLASRIHTLETLHEVAHEVEAADDLPEVFARLVDGALRLTGGLTGAVLMRIGDTLTVAASGGPGGPAPGTRVPEGSGPAWIAVRTGEPVRADQGAGWGGTGPRGGTLAAPLRLPDRTVGVLVLERGGAGSAFTEADEAAVALFADTAALVLRNATRLDKDEDRIAGLEGRIESRAAIAAGIVHDLRAPITSLSGYVQLLDELEDQLDPGGRRQILDEILSQLGRVRDMLDDLLVALAADAGRLRLGDIGPVDLADVAAFAVRTVRGSSYHGGEREVRLHAPEVVEVTGNREALLRVAVNLVDNAVRHSPPGSEIEVEVHGKADGGWLLVRDQGRGVTGSEVGQSRTSGLGLEVVRSLVAAHHGTFALGPGAGGGTVAEVRLPRA